MANEKQFDMRTLLSALSLVLLAGGLLIGKAQSDAKLVAAVTHISDAQLEMSAAQKELMVTNAEQHEKMNSDISDLQRADATQTGFNAALAQIAAAAKVEAAKGRTGGG